MLYTSRKKFKAMRDKLSRMSETAQRGDPVLLREVYNITIIRVQRDDCRS